MWGQSLRRTSKARWCSEGREPHAAGKNAGGSRTSIRPVLQTLASFGGAGVALCRSQTPSFAQKPDFTVLSHRDKTGAVASRAGAWIETCRRRPTPYSHRAWPPFGQKGAIWLLRADSGPARRIGGRARGRTGGLNGGLGRAFSKARASSPSVAIVPAVADGAACCSFVSFGQQCGRNAYCFLNRSFTAPTAQRHKVRQ